jgi:hypothetical protein
MKSFISSSLKPALPQAASEHYASAHASQLPQVTKFTKLTQLTMYIGEQAVERRRRELARQSFAIAVGMIAALIVALRML